MSTPISVTPVTELTQATLDGTGIFDVLMRATKAHLEQEFNKNRIKGPEYSTVYLGALQTTMQLALGFMSQAKKQELEAQLLGKQIALVDAQVQQAQAQLLQIQAQTAQVEMQTQAVEAQILQATAQTALIQQQKTNAQDELLTAAKQRARLEQEVVNLGAEKLRIDAQAAQLAAEALNVPKQGAVLDKQALDIASKILLQDQQRSNLQAERLGIEAKTNLTDQQKANAVLEGTVLTGQKCKLDAEFDVLVETKFKTASEKALLDQKKITEAKNPDVLTSQVSLYQAQAAGFDKDAQYKMKELAVKAWSVARTTDPDGTPYSTAPATVYTS